jgi:DNA-binding NarL/FixJ family response regulator
MIAGAGLPQPQAAPVPGRRFPAFSRAPSTEGAGKATAAAPRILVVEDEFLVGSEIEAVLGEAGFDIVGVVASAAEAVRVAAIERPLIAVVDIRLVGERDGIDAAIEMFNASGVRPIFATAHDGRDFRARAEAAAPLGWLVKPYRMEALVALIRRALQDLRQ